MIVRSTFSGLLHVSADAVVINRNVSYVPTHEIHHYAPVETKTLISHASDQTFEGKHLEMTDAQNIFTVNCGIKDSRVHPLPLGLQANYADEDSSKMIRLTKGNHKKLAYLCLGFRHLTTGQLQERQGLYKRYPFATEETGVSIQNFYSQIANHRYVFSPRGAGYDCHRVWEAFYLGSIPIIRHCPVMDNFKDMPILFVHDWSQVTEQLLNDNYQRLIDLLHTYQVQQKLMPDYWLDLIREKM